MEFTAKQKEIVARKMGYDGPMQMFDEYLAASPSDAQRYSAITSKFAEKMAKGGMVKKYATGGAVEPTISTAGTTYTAATTDVTADMMARATDAGAATTATASTVADKDIAQVGAPEDVTAQQITADTAQAGVEKVMSGVTAAQGEVSKEAQVTGVTKAPETTAVNKLEAAQGTAAQVKNVPTRTLQKGELVDGSAVDMKKVDTELAKTQAAQGTVTEEMTTQGQLGKIMADFDAGNPPPWAAASMRAATAQLAARGLGTSSLAGQAIIQAALESAIPIAQADAKVYETMGLQNLSNRQAVALQVGQQRAQFLGQEFDQNFQAKVLNAARIADIADKNFDAGVTVALENARLANTMNVANLNAKNALVLEKAAAMSALEIKNLDNLQQAAVQNAKAFLEMDLKNLDNQQQTRLFKAQEIADVIVSDTAAKNAAKATNATNKLEADRINSTLALTAQQFNATERNKVKLANMDALNELAKFNAQEKNDRAEFNANMSTQISIANAKIRAEISTANTAAKNAAYASNAKNATELSTAAYAQKMQTYRDLLEMSWKTGESTKDRAMNIATATISANASKDAAEIKATADASASWGKVFENALDNWDTVDKAITKYI